MIFRDNDLPGGHSTIYEGGLDVPVCVNGYLCGSDLCDPFHFNGYLWHLTFLKMLSQIDEL